MKSLSSALAAVSCPCCASGRMATQPAAPHKLQPNEHALNLPGATTIDAPPAGFDPISASDEDLQYHGFPPRPNQTTEPKAYATWAKAMRPPRPESLPPSSRPPSSMGLPRSTRTRPIPPLWRATLPCPSSRATCSYSSNWSGYVDFSGATSYGSTSYYYLVNDMVVPMAQQAREPAPAAGTGVRSGTVSTAGDRATCSRPALSSMRTAPAAPVVLLLRLVRVVSLRRSPHLQLARGARRRPLRRSLAHLLHAGLCLPRELHQQPVRASGLHRLSRISAEAATRPSGSLSAPTVGGSLATLTNYIMVPFWDAYAYTEASAFYDIATATPVDMEVGTTVISYPEYLGPEAFVMHY